MERREYGIQHTCFPEGANPVEVLSALTTMRAYLSGTTLGALLEKRLRICSIDSLYRCECILKEENK